MIRAVSLPCFASGRILPVNLEKKFFYVKKKTKNQKKEVLVKFRKFALST